jgi:hypothetical protein
MIGFCVWNVYLDSCECGHAKFATDAVARNLLGENGDKVTVTEQNV